MHLPQHTRNDSTFGLDFIPVLNSIHGMASSFETSNHKDKIRVLLLLLLSSLLTRAAHGQRGRKKTG